MGLAIRDLLYAKARLEEVEGMLNDDAGSSAERVLGIVVEIGLQEGGLMIAGYANGDARLLWSMGGGVVGDLYQFPNIAQAAKSLCSAAEPLAGKLPVENEVSPLPAQDMVRVAVLTMEKRYAGEAPGPDVITPNHPLNAPYSASRRLYEQLQELQGPDDGEEK